MDASRGEVDAVRRVLASVRCRALSTVPALAESIRVGPYAVLVFVSQLARQLINIAAATNNIANALSDLKCAGALPSTQLPWPLHCDAAFLLTEPWRLWLTFSVFAFEFAALALLLVLTFVLAVLLATSAPVRAARRLRWFSLLSATGGRFSAFEFLFFWSAWGARYLLSNMYVWWHALDDDVGHARPRGGDALDAWRSRRRVQRAVLRVILVVLIPAASLYFLLGPLGLVAKLQQVAFVVLIDVREWTWLNVLAFVSFGMNISVITDLQLVQRLAVRDFVYARFQRSLLQNMRDAEELGDAFHDMYLAACMRAVGKMRTLVHWCSMPLSDFLHIYRADDLDGEDLRAALLADADRDSLSLGDAAADQRRSSASSPYAKLMDPA